MAKDEVKEKEATKRPKKLSKTIEGTVLTMTFDNGKALKFDVNSLTPAIQEKCKLHGMSQKLGDAAAGKDGDTAVEAVNKTWEALAKGDWSFKVPAGPKITKAVLGEKIGTLNKKDQEEAKAILAKLGIVL